MLRSLVGSEMCIRDRLGKVQISSNRAANNFAPTNPVHGGFFRTTAGPMTRRIAHAPSAERWTPSATALPRCRRRDPPYYVPEGDSPLSLQATAQLSRAVVSASGSKHRAGVRATIPAVQVRGGGLFLFATARAPKPRQRVGPAFLHRACNAPNRTMEPNYGPWSEREIVSRAQDSERPSVGDCPCMYVRQHVRVCDDDDDDDDDEWVC